VTLITEPYAPYRRRAEGMGANILFGYHSALMRELT